MFLRSKIRRKDGKEHRAWSVVENRRVHDGRVVQRQVLYLGEINDSQRAAWSKAIEVFDEGAGQSTSVQIINALTSALALTVAAGMSLANPSVKTPSSIPLA